MVQGYACTVYVPDPLGCVHLQLKMFLPMGIMWAYNKVRLPGIMLWSGVLAAQAIPYRCRAACAHAGWARPSNKWHSGCVRLLANLCASGVSLRVVEGRGDGQHHRDHHC